MSSKAQNKFFFKSFTKFNSKISPIVPSLNDDTGFLRNSQILIDKNSSKTCFTKGKVKFIIFSSFKVKKYLKGNIFIRFLKVSDSRVLPKFLLSLINNI